MQKHVLMQTKSSIPTAFSLSAYHLPPSPYFYLLLRQCCSFLYGSPFSFDEVVALTLPCSKTSLFLPLPQPFAQLQDQKKKKAGVCPARPGMPQMVYLFEATRVVIPFLN
jgi:hypothetical protein